MAPVASIESIPRDRAEEAYARRCARLREQYLAIPRDQPVRLAKATSNLFRPRADAGQGLDVAGFAGVLRVDPEARTASVQGMTTYEQLVNESLAHGLMPLVVPQLRTITLGGAVTGLGIEAASFRNGLPHESVLELEVITGDGRVLVANAENEHADLYHGFPNSYGTLGYALRLEIELEPVRPYVRLRHLRFRNAGAYFSAVADVAENRAWDGAHVDFMDGTVFGPEAHYLTLGTMVDEAPALSDYSGRQIYYRSIPKLEEDHLSIHDYLWRWDTDWFWCSRALGLQRPRLRRLWPKRWMRSDVYWKLIALERRYELVARIDRLRGHPGHEAVIQDVEVPIDRAAEFLDFFRREVGMAPVWMCPLRLREDGGPWPLYPLDADKTYVNFGFWGTIERRPGELEGERNRLIEQTVRELGGAKSLYSTSFYEESEFRDLYGGDFYEELKTTYDPERRLLGLYEKCVKGG